MEDRFPGISVVNAGVSGDKASDMLARFDRDVLSRQPDLVSISVGVNDVWHGLYDFDAERPRPAFDETLGRTLPQYSQDLTAMLDQAREKKIRLLLLAPTPIGDDPSSRENTMVRDYATEMKRLALQYEASYCPMQALFWATLERGRKLDPAFNLTTDGVHMNEAGGHMMAIGVLSCLGFFTGSDAPAQ
jgi:lysophospholipase L1-like esterase